MESQPTIVGDKFTGLIAQDMRQSLAKSREDFRRPLPGELEKSPEQNGFILKINEFLGQELKDLGIDLPVNIKPEQIKMMSSKGAKELGLPVDFRAMYHIFGDVIVINEDIIKERYKGVEYNAVLFKIILHESIHVLSKNALYANVQKYKMEHLRSGYQMHNPQKYESHLRGFNEGVVDRLTYEIMEKHSQELQTMGLNMETIGKYQFTGYLINMEIVRAISEGIATKKQKPESEVWRAIKRGLFTGEIGSLKDIERSFGTGALRVLTAMEESENDPLLIKLNAILTHSIETRFVNATPLLNILKDWQHKLVRDRFNQQKEMAQQVKKFFIASDPDERARIKGQILNRRPLILRTLLP